MKIQHYDGSVRTVMAAKEQKQEKELTAQLLRYQGKDYNEWLHEQHQQFNKENSDVFKKLLTRSIKEKEAKI
jgi:hypothetical protein